MTARESHRGGVLGLEGKDLRVLAGQGEKGRAGEREGGAGALACAREPPNELGRSRADYVHPRSRAVDLGFGLN